MTLIGPLPDAIDPGIMARQHLGLLPTADGLGLALTWRLDVPSAGPDPPPAETALLLADVRSVHFRYWGALWPGVTEAWQDRWQGQPRLPGLVSVDIRRRDNTALAFTVSLRVTNSSACRYYPIGPICQRPR